MEQAEQEHFKGLEDEDFSRNIVNVAFQLRTMDRKAFKELRGADKDYMEKILGNLFSILSEILERNGIEKK